MEKKIKKYPRESIHYKVELENYSIEQLRAIFVESNLFSQYQNSQNHFISEDGRWMFYIHNYRYINHLEISIMDWGSVFGSELSLEELFQSKVSVEEFLEKADLKFSQWVLWNLELFLSPTRYLEYSM